MAAHLAPTYLDGAFGLYQASYDPCSTAFLPGTSAAGHLGMVVNHAQLIAQLTLRGVAVSPYMHYWTLEELTRYYTAHTHTS